MSRKTSVFATLVLLSVGQPCTAQDLVVVYPAVGAVGSATIEGRVTKAEAMPAMSADDGARDNLRRTLDLMSNDERRDRAVTVQLNGRDWPTVTDHEGYFRVSATNLTLPPGWHTIVAKTADASGESRLLIASTANTHGIVSDVDDTIQVTEVNSTRRMLSNTFLLNPLQRQVVPGIVDFYRELASANPAADAAPVFYLSASPRQLQPSLETFLQHHAFPRGVLITKRVTNDATSEPLTDQFAYKTAKLEEILARLPHVRFTLIGDDGEQDPEIFAALRTRFPDRVEAVWIRRVNPDPKRARLPDQGDLNARLAQKKTPR